MRQDKTRRNHTRPCFRTFLDRDFCCSWKWCRSGHSAEPYMDEGLWHFCYNM